MRKISLLNALKTLSPAWQFSLSAYVIFRSFYFLWSLAILKIFPLAVQSSLLLGNPILSVFELNTNQGYTYSSMVDDRVLDFRPYGANAISDVQTGSLWDFRRGICVSGELEGKALLPAEIPANDIFSYGGVAVSSPAVWAIWQRFDANWYLQISQHGYSSDGSTAFFPLYPFLIRLAGNLLGSELLGGLLLSNLALIGALYFLYRMSAELRLTTSPYRAALYLLLFPTSFFLLSVYTESVFLFFSLASFYYARRSHWMKASFWGVLAALTRLQGAILFVPFIYLWGKEKGSRRFLDLLAIMAIPFATLSFFLFTNASMLSSLETSWQARWVMPWENLFLFISMVRDGQAKLIDWLNLLMLLLAGVTCLFCWKRLPQEFAIYSFLLWLLPLFRMNSGQPFVSTLRYTLVIFPLFLLWGEWGENSWFNRFIVYTGFTLSLYLSAQFFLWGWVA